MDFILGICVLLFAFAAATKSERDVQKIADYAFEPLLELPEDQRVEIRDRVIAKLPWDLDRKLLREDLRVIRTETSKEVDLYKKEKTCPR